MNARELRIGNWLFHTGGLGYVQVTGEMIAHIERFPDEKFMTSPPRDILKPIELTGERLIKCGFEKQIVDDGFWFEIKMNGWLFITNDNYYSGNEWHIGIQHEAYKNCDIVWNQQLTKVHQLQNLYYCLTGTELEIKEL